MYSTFLNIFGSLLGFKFMFCKPQKVCWTFRKFYWTKSVNVSLRFCLLLLVGSIMCANYV